MPTFSYRAKTTAGDVVAGVLTAENERIVLARLGEMRLFPMHVAPGDGEARVVRGAGPGRVRAADLCSFTVQLSDLVVGGVPLVKGLNTLSNQTGNERLRQVVSSIRDEVSAGKSLAGSLDAYPRVFPNVYVNMVRAGEEGGFLGEALERIAEFLEKQQELRNRVRSAMAYPILLTSFGTVAVILLLTFAVPVLAQTFRDLGSALPVPTRILLKISSILRESSVLVLAVGLVGVLILNRVVNTTRGRLVFDSLKLRTPVLRNVLVRLGVSRFARTLGTLLRSGVAILTSLRIAKDSTGSVVYARAIERAAESVREGGSLAAELSQCQDFPPVVVDMVAVGEETGNLGNALVRVADRYERELDNALRIFVALLEPCILIVMGLAVLFIVLAMLYPILTMSTYIR